MTSSAAQRADDARIAVLDLVGDVDVTTQPGFRAEADVLLLDPAVRSLVVDMNATTFLDSTGIGLLVHLMMLTKANDVALLVRGVPPRIRSLLRLTQLDQILEIE